jgi:hydrogenase expression/formation protein HypE
MSAGADDASGLACPVPFSGYDRVVLAHGGGGRVMHRLVESLFVAAFDNEALRRGHDGALVQAKGTLAVTTDAFTVSPLFFPGGDIGRLAVCGTVNDLAMCGARPRYLSAAFVLEEGLPLADLERIVASMAATARACGVVVVAGDTKVVERGKGDGVYIAVTGIGEVVAPRAVEPARVHAGDAVIASGPLGEHGVAVMSVREGIAFDTPVTSDVAPLTGPVLALFDAGVDVHCLRDATRGGFATVLAEIAAGAAVGVRVHETRVPVRPAVADACELLGLDPLYVACEGRFAAFVPGDEAERAVQVLRASGCDAATVVGEVVSAPAGEVVLVGATGGERVLDIPAGEQLPRIC